MGMVGAALILAQSFAAGSASGARRDRGRLHSRTILVRSLFPDCFIRYFSPRSSFVFNILSQIGLILLMFLIGLEFDFSHLRTHGDPAFPICLLEIILPLAPDASGIQYQPQRVWAL